MLTLAERIGYTLPCRVATEALKALTWHALKLLVTRKPLFLFQHLGIFIMFTEKPQYNVCFGLVLLAFLYN